MTIELNRDAAGPEGYSRSRPRQADEAPHPAILAYIDASEKRYPDLDEIDEALIDGSPWAEGHMVGNVMGPFFYFAMTYRGARMAPPFVAETASTHNHVCFDPQTTELI